MREAYAAGVRDLAKVASKKQPANRVNCKIYQILLGTLLKFAKQQSEKP